MNAETDAPAAEPQVSQPDQDAQYADFRRRAGKLAHGAFAGADELLTDIVTSDLPDTTLQPLADAIAQATGQDREKLLRGLERGREAHTQEAKAVAALAGAADWNLIPTIMSETVTGLLLNRLIGFARRFGAEPAYFMRQHDGSVTPLKLSGLDALLSPYRVSHIDVSGQKKLIPAAAWWKNWPHRYTVDSVEYDPEGSCTGRVIENTWRGFAIEPRMGLWRCLRWHLLHVICGSKKTYFKYFIRWLAHVVQRPGTFPEVMVVLRSTAEGVGKSTVGNVIARMFGNHGLIASSARTVFGEFNEILTDKSFVLLEETAFPGEHKLAAALKNTITSPSLPINPKGRPHYIIPNRLHLMLSTNEEWAVPAGADARRYFVLDVRFDPPPGYFNRLYAEINNGGAEALLHDLLKVNLSGFEPRNIPVTPALVRQQRLSSDQITRWILDCAVAGQIVGGSPGGGFRQTITSTQLYGEFRNWANGQGIRHPTSHTEFGRSLRGLGMTDARTNSGRQWMVPDAGTLLAAAERRARIRQATP